MDRASSMMRPRLADHVAARRHVVGGSIQVVLHHLETGVQAHIGEREWRLLAAADGTRDVDGIAAAASVAGTRVGRDQLLSFLGRLDEAGMLAEGPQLPPAPEAEAPPDRPLRPLPGFVLRCDGQGSCCRIYPTTSFAPVELARARALAPEILDAGQHAASAFTPERSSARVPWRAATVTMVDGRCAYLNAESRCALHARGGPRGKPRGCQLYPASFVDDGAEVRVAPRPECACVLASAGAREGEPLLEPGLTSSRQLDPRVHVERLPPRIEIGPGAEPLPREAAAALSDALEPHVEAVDGAGLWLALADSLCAGERDPAAVLARARARDRPAAALRTVAERVDRHLAAQAWRHPGDLARAVAEWMAHALAELETSTAPAHADEAFATRALLFGRSWLLDGKEGLAAALRARAARVHVARAMAAAPWAPLGALAEHPLALVEALARGFAL